ncbi:MAG: putative zinc-binding metallopeptidase [Kiritimatiellae bacterium]|nr:putative zinc-binding metallopeptidase [Kiritimatiellia bacterium]
MNRPAEPDLETAVPQFPWASLNDRELLRWRISDLKVRIEGSPLEHRIQRLYQEFQDKGLSYRPPCYLTTEWLTPDRIPAVGIPFYLAHPRLTQLEKTMMLEAEGAPEKECMKLLRHETGHCINYAYRLYTRSRWRELFGPMSLEYNPHEYSMKPYSKQFVIHLKDNYAQVHPDEDFAETFATWLTPGLDWRSRYRGWPALKKLEYVDHLMTAIANQPPVFTSAKRYWSAAKARSTLENYFIMKRREFGKGYKGFYDPVLLRLFPKADTGSPPEPAYRYLVQNRKIPVDTISTWAGLPKYSVHELVSRLTERARSMQLTLPPDHDRDLLFRVGICLNSLLLSEQASYTNQTNP